MPTHPYIVADLICGMGMKFILIVGVGLFSRHSLNMLYKRSILSTPNPQLHSRLGFY